ncbi:hypothetical protein ACWFPY_35155 [Nocardia fluminea]
MSTPTDCRNCIRWARAYRERALDAVRHAAATAAAPTTPSRAAVGAPATQCRTVAPPRRRSRAITADLTTYRPQNRRREGPNTPWTNTPTTT